MMNSLFLISLAWILFYFLHSFLATESMKERGKKLFGSELGFRKIYVLISIVTLLMVLYLLMSLSSRLLLSGSDAMTYVSLMITTLGIMIVMRSFRQISAAAFFGLKDEKSQLAIGGIHRYVRHPIYAGTLLIFLGAFLFIPTDLMLLSVCGLLLYLPIGIHFEEKKLLKVYGDEYRTYKAKVKAVIPWLI